MRTILTLLALLGVALAGRRIKRQTSRGPLYDYVHADDGMFSWFEYDMVRQDGFTTYFLNVTSQQWYDETFTNRPVWWHYLTIHIPDVNNYPDSAFMFIGGSRNTNSPPTITTEHVLEMGEMCSSAGMVTASLKLIPNQPIIMENDGVERVEDDFIAWTWRRFYNETSIGIDNPQVLARMPMCKGAVRAMDAIQIFVKETTLLDIENFMIAGQSKRGWTTWLTGAIDDRVIAMAPVVLSCVNMVENFHHYWRSLGGWSWAMFDYWSQGLMAFIDDPETFEMQKIIDPYFYLEYMTMPKLMISGASDEFFMPDDYDYFYSDLLGEKYIWILENSGHGVDDSDLGEAEYWKMLESFYLAVLQNYQMPVMDWSKQYTADDGTITVLTSQTPVNITVWSAISVDPGRRDWRTIALAGPGLPAPTNVEWFESPVENLGNGYYRARFDNPSSGYLAFFIKATFDGPNGRTLFFTTDTAVVPNNFPFPDCEGAECNGELL